MRVVAQDAGVRRGSSILTAAIAVPYEEVDEGPLGHRVHVVDYDATTGTMYEPARILHAADVPPPDETIMGDPAFHASNVYALVVGTLARFELALGRRVGWGFDAHQLKVIPHAFEAANAFYSRESEALVFGYYRTQDRPVFTCLSHDIVVHEATHALLDGLRRRFLEPSSADQAAFHEAFADIVALLSVFALPEVVGELLGGSEWEDGRRAGLVRKSDVTFEALKSTVLLGLADEMQSESGLARVNALRRSVEIEPDPNALELPEFEEAHRRGEILVAATMRAFLDVWTSRLEALGTIEGDYLDRKRVAEEGSAAADLLLTAAIRALDYTPPIHIDFGGFLSALLTADNELRGDDRYGLRAAMKSWFGRYGIEPPRSTTEEGYWQRSAVRLGREGVHFGSLQTDPIEMFRLVWANRGQLDLEPTAFTRVESVRPCLRISPADGFVLHETVAECTQYLKLQASQLEAYGLDKPPGMDDDEEIELRGGSTLILDEFGTIKYEIHNKLPARTDADGLERAQGRLEYLWQAGVFDEGHSFAARLSSIHRLRASEDYRRRAEVW